MVDETIRRFGVPNIVYIDSSRPKAHCLFRRPKGGPFMSRIFGEMRQIAFVVRDLEKALDYWTRTLGVGPFFVMRDVVPDNYRYCGRAVLVVGVFLAFGFFRRFFVAVV